MKIDHIDRRILTALQEDAMQSQRDLADRIGLSQNACWRRLKRLRDGGIIRGARLVLDREALGLGLTVFMMIRTRHHSDAWSTRFRQHIATIPEVTELHRIGGDWDYMVRVETGGMSGYDRVYRQITSAFDLDAVTGYFSMEPILEGRPLAIPSGA